MREETEHLMARMGDLVATKPFTRKRVPEIIAADRENRMKMDHIANTLIRNLKPLAAQIKAKQSEEKANLKAKKTEERSKREVETLPGIDDLIPKYSLHKITI